jgi:hypothetical protein
MLSITLAESELYENIFDSYDNFILNMFEIIFAKFGHVIDTIKLRFPATLTCEQRRILIGYYKSTNNRRLVMVLSKQFVKMYTPDPEPII